MERETLITILGMGLVTYGTRAGGLWLMRRWSPPTWIERLLSYVPGAVLTSLTVPAALRFGLSGLAAVAVTTLVVRRTGNIMVAAALGVASIWLLRQVF